MNKFNNPLKLAQSISSNTCVSIKKEFIFFLSFLIVCGLLNFY